MRRLRIVVGLGERVGGVRLCMEKENVGSHHKDMGSLKLPLSDVDLSGSDQSEWKLDSAATFAFVPWSQKIHLITPHHEISRGSVYLSER